MAVDYLVKIELDSIKDIRYFQWHGYREISDTLDDVFNKPTIRWHFDAYNADHVYKLFLRIQTDIPNDLTEEEFKESIKVLIESYSDEILPPVVSFIKIPESFSNQDIFQLFMF